MLSSSTVCPICPQSCTLSARFLWTPFIYISIRMVSVILLIIVAVVVGNYITASFGLHTPSNSRYDLCYEGRILRVILNMASARQISVDIHPRRKSISNSVSLHLSASRFAHIFHKRDISGLCQCSSLRKWSGKSADTQVLFRITNHSFLYSFQHKIHTVKYGLHSLYLTTSWHSRYFLKTHPIQFTHQTGIRKPFIQKLFRHISHESRNVEEPPPTCRLLSRHYTILQMPEHQEPRSPQEKS